MKTNKRLKRLALAAKAVKATYAVIYKVFNDTASSKDTAINIAASQAYFAACRVHGLLSYRKTKIKISNKP